jgi:hypothetical protein
VGTASLVFSPSALNISAALNLPGIAGVSLSGSYNASGLWGLSFVGHFNVAGFGVGGWLTLGPSGGAVNATLDVGVLGIHANVHGSVQSNGSFSFTASAAVNIDILSGSIDFTLNNNGFSAHLHAQAGAIAHIGWWVFSGDVGATVTVDVSFGIRNDGYFWATGSFTATLSLLVSGSVSIGFYMDNHHLSLHMSDIGFSVWGVSFSPFSDITINY